MTVREYIGARYVPVFANPLEWDDTRTYEPLTIVSYQGNSYTSAQSVPTGVDINNEDYWVATGNYNAQVEAYRQEVQTAVTDFNDAMDGFGTAANKDFTMNVENGNNDLVTSAGVYQAIQENSSNTHKFTRGFKGSKILWVMDSWGVVGNHGVTKPYPQIFAENVGADLTLIAMGGAGFVQQGHTSGKTFGEALTDWATNNDGNTIDYVVVAGGINDYTQSRATANAAIKALVANAQTQFPNAEIILIPQIGNANMSLFNENLSYNPWTKTHDFFSDVATCTVLPGTLNMFDGTLQSQMFDTDNLHPLQAGHNYLATKMTDLLTTGRYETRQTIQSGAALPEGWYVFNSSGNTIVPNNFRALVTTVNDVVSISTQFSIKATDTSPIFLAIPQLYCANAVPNDLYCIPVSETVASDTTQQAIVAAINNHLNVTTTPTNSNYTAFKIFTANLGENVTATFIINITFARGK